MPNNQQTQMDDLVNKIHAAGSKFNKSLPVAGLKIEAEKIKDFCEQLLALLTK